MVLELIADIVFALIDLLRLSLIVAIPAFLVMLVGQKVNAFLKEKFNLSWIVSVFISTIVVLIPIVFALYLMPFMAGYFETQTVGQPVPEFMETTLLDQAMAVILTVVKNLLSALLFAILLLPMIFFGAFAEEKIWEKIKLPKLVIRFIAVLLTTALAWLIVLFVFPWIINAIFWKLYWSPI